MKSKIITICILLISTPNACMLAQVLFDQAQTITVNSTTALTLKSTNDLFFSELDFVNDLGKNFALGIAGSNSIFGSNRSFLIAPEDIVLQTGGSDRMFIDKNGKIGIGVSTPSELLEVKDGNILLNNGNLSIHDNGTVGSENVSIYSTDANASAMRIEQANSSAVPAALSIFSNTNLGGMVINNSSNTGNSIILNNNSTSGTGECILATNKGTGYVARLTSQHAVPKALRTAGEVSRNNGSTTWDVGSDRRLKRNIKGFDEGLSVVLGIHPVRFKYNGIAEYDTLQEQIGVIAQEIQQVAPYMISSQPIIAKDENGAEHQYLMYDAHALPYLLVNAVQELHAMINAQKITIELQNSQIKDQKMEIDKLKKEQKQSAKRIRSYSSKSDPKNAGCR